MYIFPVFPQLFDGSSIASGPFVSCHHVRMVYVKARKAIFHLWALWCGLELIPGSYPEFAVHYRVKLTLGQRPCHLEHACTRLLALFPPTQSSGRISLRYLTQVMPCGFPTLCGVYAEDTSALYPALGRKGDRHSRSTTGYCCTG